MLKEFAVKSTTEKKREAKTRRIFKNTRAIRKKAAEKKAEQRKSRQQALGSVSAYNLERALEMRAYRAKTKKRRAKEQMEEERGVKRERASHHT